jgi:glutaminyl-peptide cyclotransferase
MRPFKIIILFIIPFAYALLAKYPMSNASEIDLTGDFRVAAIYQHDPNSQTEGLQFLDGFLYEGTGPCLNAPSGLRKIETATWSIVKKRELSQDLFGEGITILNKKIVQLTYKTRIGFVYDLNSFELLSEFSYPTEGWGITNDGKFLIMSDGSATLRYLDPMTFHEVKRIEVKDSQGPVFKLNELEYINGELYANVFETSRIVRISPASGQVTGSINLTAMLKDRFPQKERLDLANGIAYDPLKKRLFVTGKYWSKIYELEILNKGQ